MSAIMQLISTFADRITNAFKCIGYPHSEIHDGRAYLSVYSALKDDTEFIEVRFKTPDTSRLSHMEIHIESALASTVELWKDTTKTHVALNALTSLNRRFDSVNVSGMENCHTPGGSQAGAADLLQYIGSASNNGKTDIGGNTGGRGEFVLEQDSSYLVKLTSRANNNALTIILDWYEHRDKTII